MWVYYQSTGDLYQGGELVERGHLPLLRLTVPAQHW